MKRIKIASFIKRAAAATMIVTMASYSFSPAVRAVSALAVSDSQVSDWSGVKSGDNYVFTFTVSGDPSSLGQRDIRLAYGDGQQHAPQDALILTTWGGTCKVVNSWYSDVAGGQVSASGGTVTVSVPASFFCQR